MRSLWETTALFGLAALLTACEPPPENAPSTPPATPSASTPPLAPVPVPVPAPPPPASASYKVKLQWTAPSTRSNGKPMPLSELSGYRIYYLREGSDASDDVTVVVHGGNTTTYNLTLGAPGSYTFAVTAVDLAGLESPLSGEVSIPVR